MFSVRLGSGGQGRRLAPVILRVFVDLTPPWLTVLHLRAVSTVKPRLASNPAKKITACRYPFRGGGCQPPT